MNGAVLFKVLLCERNLLSHYILRTSIYARIMGDNNIAM